MLLTFTYGRVCYEGRVEHTQSGSAFSRIAGPSDKTVKALICLLFDDSSDLGIQLGRVNAVRARIHRMLKIGLSIDDHDVDWV